jgi:hypothetical protein
MGNYRSFSVTCHGEKYKDKEMPCQDASAHAVSENLAMAIVADGHGSSRCFRSHVGSEKVIEATKNCFESWLSSHKSVDNDPEEFKDELHGIIKQIINKWFAKVMEHEEKNPLKDDPKLRNVEQKYQDRYTDTEKPENIDYRCHAYGTTLMVAAMTDKYWFAFQVGDGKCVVLYEDGTWALPIPWDDNCTFNTTTSICDDNSLGKFRYWFGWMNNDGGYEEYGYGIDSKGKVFENKSAIRPLTIFIGTDGVEDSYPRVDNDKYVINFYRNRIVTMAKGFTEFDDEIKGFAERFAERESTDDVSIAGIVGDFNDKSEMITKMKYESANHETSELLTVKKRDVEEKRDALALLQKQSGTKFDNEKQFEDKITTLVKEISDLEKKKKIFETTLAKAKSDAIESGKTLGELQEKKRVLAEKHESYIRETESINAKVKVLNNELLKRQKDSNKTSDIFSQKQDLLKKKKKEYNKLVQKLSESDEIASNKLPNNGVQRGVYDSKGHINKNSEPFLVMVLDSIKSAISPDLLEQLENFDIQICRLEHELKSLQQQKNNADKYYSEKSKELNELRAKLNVAEQHTRQVESDLLIIKQGYQTIEQKNVQHHNDVKNNEREIEQIEKQIPVKQAEIDKLTAQLEILKEQNKVQSDRIATLETAYEKAKKEVEELENKIMQT